MVCTEVLKQKNLDTNKEKDLILEKRKKNILQVDDSPICCLHLSLHQNVVVVVESMHGLHSHSDDGWHGALVSVMYFVEKIIAESWSL